MAHWGYSQLAIYRKCPLRFFWERVEKRPTKYVQDDRSAYIGNLLGRLLERFYMEQWWREPDVLHPRMVAAIRVIGDALLRDTLLPWQPGEREKWDLIARETIPRILQTVRDERLLTPLVAVEYGIKVPLGGDNDVLFGRIDYLFEGADRSLTVIDGKGGGSLGKHVSTDQLRTYALGVLADPRFGRLPDRAGFWWFRHERVVWKQFTRATLLKFVTGVKQTIADIRAKRFEARPSGDCRYCGYLTACGAGQEYMQSHVKSRDVPTETNVGRMGLNAPDEVAVK